MHTTTHEKPFWNPYVAGVFLGLVLLGTFLTMGFGLGSSAAATRLAVAGAHTVAPVAIEANAYLGAYYKQGPIFEDWMIFEVLGVFLGGLLGAYSAGRLRRGAVEKGVNMSVGGRLGLAIAGGVLMGAAARLARGCTSGQALTGGTVFSLGSWIFMIGVFAAGYLVAPLVRRQWR
jgi:hypothetical protein